MSTTINGTTGVTFPDATIQNTAASGFGFKNRIINGACMIDQRNAGASVTPADGAYTLDRWKAKLTQASKFTVQQSSTATTGFINSLLVTSSSAYSVGASDRFDIVQAIEGLNVADLGWGAAGASTVTLSFWVRSSLTGTFGGALGNSAGDRSYPFSYTISAANTFEQKTITIAGDTTGTWLKTNGAGIYLYISIGAGSTYSGTAGAWNSSFNTSATGATSVVGTSGATFYITGVQLEKGSTATSFDYRPYGTELALCQRYYEKSYNTDVAVGASSAPGRVQFTAGSDQNGNQIVYTTFKVSKRSTPTFNFWTYQGTAGSWNYDRSGASGSATENVYNEGLNGFSCYLAVGSGYAVCECYGHWAASSEL